MCKYGFRYGWVILTLILIALLANDSTPTKAAVEPSSEPAYETIDLTHTAITYAPPQAANSAKPPSSSIDTNWWKRVQQDIRQSEYHITWQKQTHLPGSAATYQAPNRVHNLRAYFGPDDIRVTPRTETPATWEWGLSLTHYGYANHFQPATLFERSTLNNRITYVYNGGALVQRYVNDESGLQQSLTLSQPPMVAGRRSSEIILDLTLCSGLTPNLTDGGRAVEFADASGIPILRYAGLRAADATGRQLPIHLELQPTPSTSHHTLRVTLDISEATFPLTLSAYITRVFDPPHDWMAEGNQAGAALGYAVSTAGDVNNDGYADVIVGALYYDNGQVDEGIALAYYGSASGPSLTPDWTFEGDQGGADLGISVGTAGDVNDDGYDDVIVGAYAYDNPEPNEGAVFVFYGSPTGLSPVYDWMTDSNQSEARFGKSVGTAGDVNDDGYADVIVGAYAYDNPQTDEGAAFLFLGSDAGLSPTYDWMVESDQPDAYLGTSVGTAGDVDDDGYADVIVGAERYNGGQNQEGRAYVYHGSATGLEPSSTWTFESDQSIARLGGSVGTAGDVNDDGYADVIVGAYGYDSGQGFGEGRVYVFHGSDTGLGPSPNWTADSNQGGSYFGIAVGAAGDVNGDGYADVVVGSENYDHDQTDEGAAFVWYGSATGLGDNGNPTNADWVGEGDQDGAALGARSVGTAGDVNGDGYDDVIVGATTYDHPETNEGAALIYYGAPTGLGPGADWSAEGDQDGAGFGTRVSTAGDVNGDGYSDVIVGAPLYDNGETDEGRVYAYHGSPAGLSLTPAWITESNQVDAWFGSSLSSAGDVNGDGYADVIVGARQYGHGEADEGAAFVFHGSAAGLSPVANWMTESNQLEAHLGWGVGTAGDVDGDGYSDVVVGASHYDNDQTNEGRVFVFYGSTTGLSPVYDWMAEGNQTDAGFGCWVGTAGDVDGDGFADLVVGANWYDGDLYNEGAAFLFHGSASGPSPTYDWMAEGDQTDADFGRSVGTAGDVNGDGYSDLFVTAPYYDYGHFQEGRAYVYHGSVAGLSATPDWFVEGNQTEALLGVSGGTAGDVDGDGYADVIVGAPRYDDDQTNEGQVYLYRGSAAGLGSTPAWVAEGEQVEAWFGSWVSTAGDVNGDGYSDVIVGSLRYDDGQTDEGAAFVFHGSSEGLSDTPGWAVESEQPNARLGSSVSTAGDVNGDGYADVIVGAPWYDSGLGSQQGRAFIFHGSAEGPSPAADWSVDSDVGQANLGASVSTAGDVNGDGYSDVLVGAPTYDVTISATASLTEAGRAFVYYGSSTGVYTTPAWTAEGDQAYAHLGYSVDTAGDVDGDGYADLAVAALLYDADQVDEGAVFVYHGSASGLSSAPNWTAEGDQEQAQLGYGLSAAGDVDGDGYSDLVVGAPYYDVISGSLTLTDAGRALVYHGSAAGLSLAPAWAAEGDQAYALLGLGVGAAGDVDGDGYADLVVGAPKYDHEETDEGIAYLFPGSPAGLSPSPTWAVEGNQASAQFGERIGTAGDVNGDGLADLIVAATGYEHGQADEGMVFLFPGSPAGLSPSHAWTAEGDQDNALFGTEIGAAGDVNGDGYADVVIGAKHYSNGQYLEGGAFLFYGDAADGLACLPRQVRVDGSAPISPLGLSDARDAVQLRLVGRNPLGREQVKLQWQVAPLGTPFSDTGVIGGTSLDWTDTLTTGALITQNVTGLAQGTPYHWRVRLLYPPDNLLGQPSGRWIHMPWNGWAESDFRTPGPVLTLSKVASDPMPNEGDVITYTVVVRNSGTYPATDALVSDTLPAELNFLGPVVIDPPGAGIPGVPPVLAHNLTITASQAVTLSFPVIVLEGPASLTNTAAVSSAEVFSPVLGTIVITSYNTAPDLLNLSSNSPIYENTVLTLTGNILDPGPLDSFELTIDWGDGDVVTYTYPTGASAFSETHLYPDDEPSGTPSDPYTLSLTLVDDDGGIDTDLFDITVTNLPPLAAADSYSATEDLPLSVTAPGVLANDYDVPADSLSVSRAGDPSHGNLALNPDGSFVYTPSLNFHGEDVFSYTVSDDDAGSATASVAIDVAPVNDPPVAADDAADTPEDTAISVPVLDNDDDPDGDVLSVVAVGAPAHGSASTDGTTVTYTPTLNFYGGDTFSYTISDGALSDSATVSLTVTPVNDPPVAADDTANTPEDTPRTIAVLGNDSDPDGDALSVVAVGAPAHGSASTDGTTVTYTPTLHFIGMDVFGYTISDPGGLTDTAAVTVNVGAENDPPIAQDDTAETPEDTPISVPVLDNDSDPDGDTLSLIDVGTPAHGQARISGNSVTYTPTLNFYGGDTFSYTISDGALSDSATVSLTVTPVNDPPTISDIPNQSTWVDAPIGPIAFTVGDVETPAADLSLSAQSSNLVLLPLEAIALGGTGAARTITLTPTLNLTGTAIITLTVSDGFATASDAFELTVSGSPASRVYLPVVLRNN